MDELDKKIQELRETGFFSEIDPMSYTVHGITHIDLKSHQKYKKFLKTDYETKAEQKIHQTLPNRKAFSPKAIAEREADSGLFIVYESFLVNFLKHLETMTIDSDFSVARDQSIKSYLFIGLDGKESTEEPEWLQKRIQQIKQKLKDSRNTNAKAE